MKRKRVNFADCKRLDESDIWLRSPGSEYSSYEFFSPPLKSKKSILKKKLNEQKELTNIKYSIQKSHEKYLFKAIYTGCLGILNHIIRYSPKEQRNKSLAAFFKVLGDFQFNSVITFKKVYHVAGISTAKKAHILDLYFGASKLHQQEETKSNYRQVCKQLRGIHKNRLHFSGNQDYNFFKDNDRNGIIKTLLKEYIHSMISISQGSHFEDNVKEFKDLITFLYDQFSSGKIVSGPEIISLIQSELNDMQIDVLSITELSPPDVEGSSISFC